MSPAAGSRTRTTPGRAEASPVGQIELPSADCASASGSIGHPRVARAPSYGFSVVSASGSPDPEGPAKVTLAAKKAAEESPALDLSGEQMRPDMTLRDDLLALLETLNIRDVVLAGHSMGGTIGMMLAAVFMLGTHSTFFGPIKYAILPQHLKDDEVLGEPQHRLGIGQQYRGVDDVGSPSRHRRGDLGAGTRLRIAGQGGPPACSSAPPAEKNHKVPQAVLHPTYEGDTSSGMGLANFRQISPCGHLDDT